MANWDLSGLLTTFLFGVKLALISLLVFYFAFSLIFLQKVRLLSKIIETGNNRGILTLAYSNSAISLIFLVLSIFLL